MNKFRLGANVMAVTAALSLAGCASVGDALDAVNPLSPSGPKMAELTPIKTSVEVRQRWSLNIGKAGGFAFRPAVDGRQVYAAAADGTLAKIEDGKFIWRIQAGQPLSAGVGSDGRLVVVGTAKGDVLAFSAEDGKALWQAKVTSEVLAAPEVGTEGVAVKTGDNRVFLLDAKDGKRKWMYERATPALSLRNTAGPLFSDRYIVSGFPGGKLMALDVRNGAPVWEGTVALPKGATELDRVADIVSRPVIEGRQICGVAYQGRIACFDLGQGGALTWARDFSSAAGMTVDGRYLFATDDKGAVHALDRNSGASLWKQDKLLNRRVTSPLVKRGAVVVSDAQGVVHFLGRDDGAFVARLTLDGTPVVTPPQSVDTMILIQTSGGTITAIEVQ